MTLDAWLVVIFLGGIAAKVFVYDPWRERLLKDAKRELEQEGHDAR